MDEELREWLEAAPESVKAAIVDARKSLENANRRENSNDPERAHGLADGALCVLLEAMGLRDIVDEWDRVPKWYA